MKENVHEVLDKAEYVTIYQYTLDRCAKRLTKKLVQVVEKPATYISAGSVFNTRYQKADIGRVNRYGTTLVLLEDDIKKAASLFIEFEEEEKHKYECWTKLTKECIEYLKGIMNE